MAEEGFVWGKKKKGKQKWGWGSLSGLCPHLWIRETPVALAQAFLRVQYRRNHVVKREGRWRFSWLLPECSDFSDLNGERGKSLTSTAGDLNVAGLLPILRIMACHPPKSAIGQTVFNLSSFNSLVLGPCNLHLLGKPQPSLALSRYNWKGCSSPRVEGATVLRWGLPAAATSFLQVSDLSEVEGQVNLPLHKA